MRQAVRSAALGGGTCEAVGFGWLVTLAGRGGGGASEVPRLADLMQLSYCIWESEQAGGDMSDEVLVERRGAVQVITINRPEARNAISGPDRPVDGVARL